MVKRTQGLPLNTIILAIIAIIVLVFLILIFTGGIGKFVGQTSQVTSSNQTSSAVCSEYASSIQTSMGTSTDPNNQLQLLASSQYVSSNCSVYFQYSFTLYNGSEVACGLGPNYCIMVSSNQGSGSTGGGSGSPGTGGSGGSGGSGGTGGGSSSSSSGNAGSGGSGTGTSSNCNECTPPGCILGCQLQ